MAKKRDSQLRARVSEDEKTHLERAAQDAGYTKANGDPHLSEYVRAVLLNRHVIAVGAGEGAVLIPAAASSEAEQARVERELERVLAAANGQPVDVRSPDPAPETAPHLAEGGGADGDPAAEIAPSQPAPAPGPAAQLAAAANASPAPVDAGDVVVGASESPAGVGEELCSRCGFSVDPRTHTLEECQRYQAARAAEVAGTDARALRPDEIEPDPHPPLGGLPREGETEITFLSRRVEELKEQGRPPTIARQEAGAEWRAAAGGGPHPFESLTAPAGAPRVPIPGLDQAQPIQVATPPPAAPQAPPALQSPGPLTAAAPVVVAPWVCGNCSNVNTTPAPCPNCGAS